jgi:hypothetical protein
MLPIMNERYIEGASRRDQLRYKDEVRAHFVAQELYRKVERKAKRRKFFCRFLKRCYTLRNLSRDVSQRELENSYSKGIQAVELNRICGSESRSNDFDSIFNPLTEKNRSRWVHIAQECLLGHSLPAVELIQVGSEYFVRDGHHRISVMRTLGYQFVDAQVTVWRAAD